MDTLSELCRGDAAGEAAGDAADDVGDDVAGDAPVIDVAAGAAGAASAAVAAAAVMVTAAIAVAAAAVRGDGGLQSTLCLPGVPSSLLYGLCVRPAERQHRPVLANASAVYWCVRSLQTPAAVTALREHTDYWRA
jgi:hypothetical protein